MHRGRWKSAAEIAEQQQGRVEGIYLAALERIARRVLK
jgi:hypothetical protein